MEKTAQRKHEKELLELHKGILWREAKIRLLEQQLRAFVTEERLEALANENAIKVYYNDVVRRLDDGQYELTPPPILTST